jgi:RHS repeat-associated protein
MLSDGRVLYVPGVGQWDGQAWTYELPDGLGSLALSEAEGVRQLVDSQGYLVQRYEYSPFGEALASEGRRTNSLRYTGEQWDNDTGLLYLRARWYDPSVGRFTTRDPFPGFSALPQTQHPYVYVGNNPINLTDPSGKLFFIPVLIVAAAGGLLGGTIYYTAQSYLNRDPCAGMKWDWREAAFWGVAGTGLGAILGTGIYGGWWLGVQVGWWGPAATGIWTLPWWQRGQVIEDQLGRNLPRNFPTIDRFVNGVATSIKSIDLGAPSYQDLGRLSRTVKGYIDTMAAYQGQSAAITGRAVELAIPASGATPTQMAVLQQLQQYAQNVGVTLSIVKVP